MPDDALRHPPQGHAPYPPNAPEAERAHDSLGEPLAEMHGRPPAPKRLKLVAIVVLIGALAAAGFGILTRKSSDQALTTWTDNQAVPTVAVAPPDHSDKPQSLVLPGDVQAFYEAPLYARVSGFLKSWSQDIGAHVKSGQTLAIIETPDLDEELAQAQADLATARANSSFADLTAKRWHALLASNSVSVQSADEKEGNATAQRAMVNAQLAHVNRLQALEAFKRITAPFDGIVTARNTDVGALITGGSSAAVPLFKVADMHEMRVYVRVPQAYASQLAVGMQASLTLPQYPGVTFPATLATTSQSVAADSRTVLVELMAANAQGKLWAGNYAEVRFDLPSDSHVLRVPSSALIFRSHGAEVATVTQDGKLAMKRVTIGRNLGTQIEITGGLGEADRVVTAPLDTLEDGEPVQVSNATPPPGAAGAQGAE